MGKHFHPDDDRYYGARYADSFGDDLFLVAGRILSDIKTDQRENKLPNNAVIIVAVQDSQTTISVQVHITPDQAAEPWAHESIRTRVNQIGDRYNWRGIENRADRRYRFFCQVRMVRSRYDAIGLGSVIG